jgi:hypothetical protein
MLGASKEPQIKKARAAGGVSTCDTPQRTTPGTKRTTLWAGLLSSHITSSINTPLNHSHFDFLSYISVPCCCLAFLCSPSVYHLSTPYHTVTSTQSPPAGW